MKSTADDYPYCSRALLIIGGLLICLSLTGLIGTVVYVTTANSNALENVIGSDNYNADQSRQQERNLVNTVDVSGWNSDSQPCCQSYTSASILAAVQIYFSINPLIGQLCNNAQDICGGASCANAINYPLPSGSYTRAILSTAIVFSPLLNTCPPANTTGTAPPIIPIIDLQSWPGSLIQTFNWPSQTHPGTIISVTKQICCRYLAPADILRMVAAGYQLFCVSSFYCTPPVSPGLNPDGVVDSCWPSAAALAGYDTSQRVFDYVIFSSYPLTWYPCSGPPLSGLYNLAGFGAEFGTLYVPS